MQKLMARLAALLDEDQFAECEAIVTAAGVEPPSEPVSAWVPEGLAFADAVRIARGCKDYGGGYRSNAEHFEIYQHGIGTVINALEDAEKRGLASSQTRALHAIGTPTAPKVSDSENTASGEGEKE